jgi:hypothetical protein
VTGRWRVASRPLPAALAAALAGLLLAVGGVLFYLQAEVVDSRSFSGRLVSSLDDPSVRTVVTDRVVDGLVNASSGDVLTVRPLVSTAVESLVGTSAFRAAATLTATEAHRLLLGDGSVLLELRRGATVVLDALRSVSPAAAARISPAARPLVADVDSDNGELAAGRRLLDLTRWRWLALAACAVCVGISVLLAGGARRALAYLGAAAAGAGALVAGAVTIGGALLKDQVASSSANDPSAQRSAIAAVWRSLFGDLRTSALVVMAGGLLIAALSAGLFDARRPVGGAWRAARALPVPRHVRTAALLLAGAACLIAPGGVLRVLALAVGLGLVAIGLLRVIPAGSGEETVRPRSGLVVGAGLVAALAAGTAAVLVALGAPALPKVTPAASASGCNGSVQLCNSRIDDVVFPATHNSFAAADEPGWLFPNQRYPIARQLSDGIRGLLVDVHHGVLDENTGRVRTDLRADGSDRNKAARALTPEALRLADRLAGRVGAGNLSGPRGLYLCHTLCEIGAEPLGQELGVIRDFLERNRSQVLVVIVEDYVPPAQIEAAFGKSGLLPYVASFDRSAPLPTLGDLVRTGNRLVVLAEVKGGSPPWYMPAFSFAQDTPYQASSPADLSCRRYRGDRDSPLLLLNHWIARFPPRPSDQAGIGGNFLRERVQRCTRERGIVGALVAVDFYERTGVVQTARELNDRSR